MFRKICLVTSSRSDYAKVRYLAASIKNDPSFEFSVIAAGSHPYDRFGFSIQDIFADGFNPIILRSQMYGDSLLEMMKTISLHTYECSIEIDRIKPDLGIIVGDRYDILPAAMSFCLMNIPLAHIQGGEISGTIDDVIRNVITKLSHLHFVSNDACAKRVKNMGEDSAHIYSVGCPSIDFIQSVDVGKDVFPSRLQPWCKKDFNLSKQDKYFLVMLHPNVTIPSDINMQVVFEALSCFPNKKVLFYPTNDPCHQYIVNFVKDRTDIIKFKHLPMEEFIILLAHCSCIIGNSRAGIRESASFRVPFVNIGERQLGRDRNTNTVDVACQKDEIVAGIKRALAINCDGTNIYGHGNSSQKIIEVIKSYASLDYKNIHKIS